MSEKALMVLSGDPITNGHIDVIKRARECFGSLRVALAINPQKKYTFDLSEREALTRIALQGVDVAIDSFPGHTIDYAKMNDIHIIVRSVRSSVDFNFEKMLNQVGNSQDQGIETVLFFAKQNLTHISSSAVKELQRLHGLIHDYVPFSVKQSLEKKISKQLLIGLTGEIGAGKSFIANAMVNNNTIHEIDMDRLGHEILEKNDTPLFVSVRKEIVNVFGKTVIKSGTDENPYISTKKLGSIIFSDKLALRAYNSIMKDPMLALYREKLRGKEGIIFVSSALIAEAGIGYLTNNNVIVVHADKIIREDRLKKRGYSDEETRKRMEAQLNHENKMGILSNRISSDKHGCVWDFDNSSSSIEDIQKTFSEQNIRTTFEKSLFY